MFLLSALLRGVVAFVMIMCLGIAGLHLQNGVNTAELAQLVPFQDSLPSVDSMKAAFQATVNSLL